MRIAEKNSIDAVARTRLDDAVADIRQQFLDGLCERILALETLATDIRSSSGGERELRQIAAILHRVSGLAPSLGFQNIGQKSGSLEVAIDRGLIHASPHEVWNTVEGPLDRLLDDLESLLDSEN